MRDTKNLLSSITIILLVLYPVSLGIGYHFYNENLEEYRFQMEEYSNQIESLEYMIMELQSQSRGEEPEDLFGELLKDPGVFRDFMDRLPIQEPELIEAARSGNLLTEMWVVLYGCAKLMKYTLIALNTSGYIMIDVIYRYAQIYGIIGIIKASGVFCSLCINSAGSYPDMLYNLPEDMVNLLIIMENIPFILGVNEV